MNNTKSKITSAVFEWVKPMLFALALLALIMISGFRVVTVQGASMDTTLESGEKVITTNFMYTPKSGDIVVISKGEHHDSPIIKRVIAVEGQRIELDYDNDKIYVDGKELNEPYLKCSTFGGRCADYNIPSVVPEGKLFVLGDNRGVSLDSRSSEIGLIDKENVVGKAHFAVFPFDRFGGLESQ
ncbi:MAG: signal peptidase I [Ruminococcus sp.]|nr:signal peptidase I [Ruminococcus sp.]